MIDKSLTVYELLNLFSSTSGQPSLENNSILHLIKNIVHPWVKSCIYLFVYLFIRFA
jgi:hypothetical protein